MLQDNIIPSKEEVKRRKSAQINSFPSINSIYNNLNTSYKSTSDLCSAQPVFKSNSLFAYQELDQFSSFCDDVSNKSEFFSEFHKNSQNNNLNNNSTKNEDGEQSESDDGSFENINMSEDEIFFKKYNHRMKKRKSALHSYPAYLKTLPYLNKPNEVIYNNNFSNSDKKKSKNEINNNINNSNFISGNNNYPYNIRRNSNPINQFKNIFFNNILYQNQNNFSYPNNFIENNNNNTNNINDKNNYLNNNINNINNLNNNNTNNQNLNFIQNIQNQNTAFNNPIPNNFPNYNYIQNFPYNNYYNNNSSNNCINNNMNKINQNSCKKKRNSQIIIKQNQLSQNAQQRRSSHMPLNSNFKIIGTEKHFDKGKIKEEDPNYFLKDQLYCRQIQNKLEKNVNNIKYTEEFYEIIKPYLIEIIEHQFGNYVIQKFFDILLAQGNKVIFEDIFVEIDDKLFSLCVHNYGTRVIQKTLEKLDKGNYSKIETEKLNSIFKSLIEKHLYQLCCDKNGNHVYQKLLRVFPKENNKNNFLYDELIKISYEVSIIQQGATLLSVAFEYSNKEQKEKLCEAIIERIGDLITDKYGNYTIQTVLHLFEEKINEKIYKYIDDNLFKLSIEKFSSNVIDKCLIKDYDKSNKLIESMIQKNIIKDLIIDQFGNYPVQKAMSVSDKETCEKIGEQIKPMLEILQSTNIGKKIYEKLWLNYKDYLQ